MPSAPSDTSLQISRSGDADEILVITLDRPHRRNAVDQQLADELSEAMELLEHGEGLRAGVLTGSGGYFSAGSDLALDASPATPDGGEYGFVRRRRTRPLVAAVEGFALGGGMEMVMACDLVVAAQDATFGLPETLRGVVANCGALFRGPAKLTPNVALELLLTGSRLDAVRAHELGFVNRLATPGGALEDAVALAQLVSAASPSAVATSLRAIAEHSAASEAHGWQLTEAAAAQAAASPDRTEGIAAFFEKRAPRWNDQEVSR